MNYKNIYFGISCPKVWAENMYRNRAKSMFNIKVYQFIG